MRRLEDKIAFITGGTSGLGYAMAELFSAEGASVIITGRGREKGLSAANRIKNLKGTDVRFFPCDVSRENDVRDVVKQIIGAHGRIDVLVSNAGYFAWGKFEDASDQEWELMMNTNLRGCFYCCKYCVPHMIRNGKGSIIVTSSVVGLSGKAYVPLYSAAKGGLTLLAKSLALRYAKHNIRVNSICPGTVITDLNRDRIDKAPDPDKALREIVSEYPLGRLGRTTDVAYAALYLASDESGWVTGIALPVDGGYSAGK